MQKTVGNGSVLDQYFSEGVMSLHLKDKVAFARKQGSPGNVNLVIDDKQVADKKFLHELIDSIFDEVERTDDGFLEIDRTLLKIVQLGPYRIVIVYPPLSDGLELTIVRPVSTLTMDDYDLDPAIRRHLEHDAKGVLISGAPGSGKTTFAQAIIEQHKDNNQITKTIESPRDLQVSDAIVQYSFSYGSHSDIRDILLLSRPDFCVFDEVRNVDDFLLFKDLRLTGIGLLGVIHATRAIDGVQRFLGHVELGVIPQMVDTIVFIDKGVIANILQLKLVVKVPHGMESSDLSRPVIQVYDFSTKEVVYEIYSFGEQIVVMPIEDVQASPKATAMNRHALKSIKMDLESHFSFDFVMGVSGSTLSLYVPEKMKPRVIGTGGKNVQSLEKELGMSISVKTFTDLPLMKVDPEQELIGKGTRLLFKFDPDLGGRSIALLTGSSLMKTQIDERGTISVAGKAKVHALKRKSFVIVDMEGLV